MSVYLSSAPSTPTSSRHTKSYDATPQFSSPLASPASSPISAAQERRRTQFKSQYNVTPSNSRQRPSTKLPSSAPSLSALKIRSVQSTPAPEAPQKQFLRERFRARCFERAARDRERKINGKRPMLSEPSSDMECEDEDEEEGDSLLNDELFGRIMASVEHQRKHSYKVSYSWDVGSSFDPNIEEEIEWEKELKESQDAVPDDLDEEELEEWAAEQELLEGLTADEIFSLSDMDEPPAGAPQEENDDDEILWRSFDKGKIRAVANTDGDVDMDF